MWQAGRCSSDPGRTGTRWFSSFSSLPPSHPDLKSRLIPLPGLQDQAQANELGLQPLKAPGRSLLS